jgi:hypothetical protein
MNTRRKRYFIAAGLMVMLLTVLSIVTGCGEEITETPAHPSRVDLSLTRVPNIDLDLYIYVEQENPTTVSRDILGTPFDIAVDSLAVWGVATEDEFTVSGGLLLSSTTDAQRIYDRIEEEAGTWTTLSGRTIYFVLGTGYAAENFKAAITNNDFKNYDDQKALLEVGMLPDSGTTKRAAVCIIRPSETLVRYIAENTDAETGDMINSIYKQGRLQTIAAGLYAPGQIDIAELIRKVESGDIWESDLGIIVLLKSGWPGFIVSPVVNKVLENEGYMREELGELRIYRGQIDPGIGRDIPFIIRVAGNRVFAVASLRESYAQTLIKMTAR